MVFPHKFSRSLIADAVQHNHELLQRNHIRVLRKKLLYTLHFSQSSTPKLFDTPLMFRSGCEVVYIPPTSKKFSKISFFRDLKTVGFLGLEAPGAPILQEFLGLYLPLEYTKFLILRIRPYNSKCYA